LLFNAERGGDRACFCGEGIDFLRVSFFKNIDTQ